MAENDYKVLVVAGYDSAKKAFGKAVIAKLKRGYFPNAELSYLNVLPRGDKPGTLDKSVEDRIEDKACGLGAHLILDIRSPEDAVDMGLVRDNFMYGLDIEGSLWHRADYCWYREFTGQHDDRMVEQVTSLDPNQVLGFGATWFAIRAYLGSLANGRNHSKSEVDAVAGIVEEIIIDYIEHRETFAKCEEYRRHIDMSVIELTREWLNRSNTDASPEEVRKMEAAKWRAAKKKIKNREQTESEKEKKVEA